jgi:hypothetical protein
MSEFHYEKLLLILILNVIIIVKLYYFSNLNLKMNLETIRKNN